MTPFFARSLVALLVVAAVTGCQTRPAAEVSPPGAPAAATETVRATIPSHPAAYGKRAFQIINLSLPRTGSTSIAGIFDHLGSSHEFMMEQTVMKVLDWREGKLSTEALDEFLRERDQTNEAQVDSTTFLHLAQDRLFALFPNAQYMISVRDGEGWFVSYVDLLVAFAQKDPSAAKEGMGIWAERYGRLMSPSFRGEDFAHPETLGKHLEPALPDYAAYWGHWTVYTLENLKKLPKERRLIIRTKNISQSLDKMASFAGVPVSSLNHERTHLNKRRKVVDVMQIVDAQKLHAAFQPWQAKVDALMKDLEAAE